MVHSLQLGTSNKFKQPLNSRRFLSSHFKSNGMSVEDCLRLTLNPQLFPVFVFASWQHRSASTTWKHGVARSSALAKTLMVGFADLNCYDDERMIHLRSNLTIRIWLLCNVHTQLLEESGLTSQAGIRLYRKTAVKIRIKGPPSWRWQCTQA